MWKFVTRGIRETLERRASCRTNVYSQTSNDGTPKNEVKTNLAREQKFLAPNIGASCNSGFWGSTKNDGPKDKRYDSKWDTRRTWSEAVGWSSVLAVGWVVCQSLCHRARLFEPSKEDKWHNRLLRLDSLPPSLVDSFDLRPRRVLPVTNCVGNVGIDGREDYSRREGVAPRPYGPITIEEALKEAKDDYTKTHRIVMGEFELRFGVKALEENRYKDALKHFSTGASLSSSGSMFNLGLCHELGIGTVTDAIKAAKYYKSAAERGHPDAMYNLGVFHAQGRGGLSLDVEKARELFARAADLGQTQALMALDIEKNSARLDEPRSDNRRNSIGRDGGAARRPLRVTECEASAGSRDDSGASSKTTYYDDSREFAENPTDAFLRSLGIQAHPQPILVGSGDSNVPYYS